MTGTTGSKRGLRFIFITPCVGEDFFNVVKKGMRDAAAIMDVECSFVGTEDVDIDQQVQMVRQAIAEGYDGIARLEDQSERAGRGTMPPLGRTV